MRILYVNEKCGYFGGVEQNIADSAEGLTARGHECFLAFQEVTGRQVAEFQANFKECVPIHSWQHSVDRIKPDVIYIHKTNVGLLQDGLEGVRSVRMIHDHDLCCPRHHKYYAWNGRVCRHKADWRCYLDMAFLERVPGSRQLGLVSIGDKMLEMRRNRQLSLLLVASAWMREELIQNGFAAERIETLPYAVRMPLHGMAPIPKENRILYVGQLIRGKGVDLLLKALPHLCCDYELTIAGTGNAQHSLEQLSRKLGLTGKVRFAGWVGPQDIGDYYAKAKVSVVPSRWPEPFGMVGLEAMHYGRPVVGFNVGGIPDWLEHGVTGLLVPEQDVRAFANALEQLLEDPHLCLKLGEQAQERVRTKFSFENYLDRLEALLSGKS